MNQLLAINFDQPDVYAPSKVGSIAEVVNFVLPIITAGAALLMLAMLLYGAFTWITAGEKADNVAKAWKIITFSIIGFVFIIISFTLVQLISAIFGIKELPF